MLLRALLLLGVALALSVAATLFFGDEVLVALGLILLQIKVIAKKLMGLELPVVLGWLKAQAAVFFRVELLKKWVSPSVVPLVLGSVLLRRISAFQARYVAMVKAYHQRMTDWYMSQGKVERYVAAIAILAVMLAMSVSSIGLWLVLFSVKLPLWIGAAITALGRMILSSVEKSAFKAVAFLQLNWLWRGVKRILPRRWLERKRRFDFRVARAIVKRRRLTVQQLAERKDGLPFRMGFLLSYVITADPEVWRETQNAAPKGGGLE